MYIVVMCVYQCVNFSKCMTVFTSINLLLHTFLCLSSLYPLIFLLVLLCVCLSLFLSVFLSINMMLSPITSVRLSVFMSVCLQFFCLSVRPSSYLNVILSVRHSVYPSFCQSVTLSVRHSVCPSFSLSVIFHLFISWSDWHDFLLSVFLPVCLYRSFLICQLLSFYS